ncbi:lectin like domain-containing protein [Vallitalea okinawensis]|uniref:lectin like domain-containing protein n=1 Tax=Vallitalea okinawensis TaxID=2078660 RepID=UPI00147909DE|nr:lectin like domain-containing protein [Vallitalea okinawensis]
MKRILTMIFIMSLLTNLIQLEAAEKYPTRYDLREQDRMTPVKEQGELGSCWALATTAALESTLLTQEGKIYDLSENNMVTQLSDYYSESFHRNAGDGGDDNMAVGYLASWRGPVLETDDPYAVNGREKNIVYRTGMDPVKHVQEALFLPQRKDPLDNELIKDYVINYGGIFMTMWKGTPSTYGEFYHEDHFAWYYPYDYMNDKGGGHAITIVGWDDEFSKENFRMQPPGDGAFIAKNTKGSEWGHPNGIENMGGYFYISYYDGMLGDPLDGYVGSCVFTRIDNIDNYDHIYQYDLLGYTEPLVGQKKESWFANRFIIDKGDGESLEALSFYTLEQNLDYEIWINESYTSQSSLNQMKKIQSGHMDLPGYHTVDLDQVIGLQENQEIVVAVKLMSNTIKPSIAIESPNGDIASTAKAEHGESFIKTSSSWSDLNMKRKDANVCLKLFTKDQPQNLITVENMQKDVEFLIEWILTHQPDARRSGYTATQQQVIDKVREAIQEPLTEGDFIIQLKRLYAMMNDGHTKLYKHPQKRFMNITFEWLEAGIFVIKDYNGLIKGDQILKLGGKTPDELVRLLKDIVSSENDYWIQEQGITYLNDKAYLDYLGLTNDDGTIDIDVKRGQDTFVYRIGFEETRKAYSIRYNNQWYDWYVSDIEDLAYLRFDNCIGSDDTRFADIQKAIDQLFIAVEDKGVDNFVIDLRYNDGGGMQILNYILMYLDKETIYGDVGEAYTYYQQYLEKKKTDSLFSGNIYVLTSNYTYSAAVLTTRILHDNQLAILVGEPTGENPAFNYHGNSADGHLPVSGYEFMMTSQHASRIKGYDNSELSFYPDIPIFITPEDIHTSRDTQMELLKKVINDELIYSNVIFDIDINKKMYIKPGDDFYVDGDTVYVNEELSGVTEEDIKVMDLATKEEVRLAITFKEDGLVFNLPSSIKSSEAYIISINLDGVEYRVVMRDLNQNIEKDFTPEVNASRPYTINNIPPKEVVNDNTPEEPLKIVYDLEYKPWNAFQMKFNKWIKIKENYTITIKDSNNEDVILQHITVVGEEGYPKSILFIKPEKQLESGTYQLIIPAGTIESIHGHVYDKDIDVTIIIAE